MSGRSSPERVGGGAGIVLDAAEDDMVPGEDYATFQRDDAAVEVPVSPSSAPPGPSPTAAPLSRRAPRGDAHLLSVSSSAADGFQQRHRQADAGGGTSAAAGGSRGPGSLSARVARNASPPAAPAHAASSPLGRGPSRSVTDPAPRSARDELEDLLHAQHMLDETFGPSAAPVGGGAAAWGGLSPISLPSVSASGGFGAGDSVGGSGSGTTSAPHRAGLDEFRSPLASGLVLPSMAREAGGSLSSPSYSGNGQDFSLLEPGSPGPLPVVLDMPLSSLRHVQREVDNDDESRRHLDSVSMSASYSGIGRAGAGAGAGAGAAAGAAGAAAAAGDHGDGGVAAGAAAGRPFEPVSEVLYRRERRVHQKELDLEAQKRAFDKEVEERERREREWRQRELHLSRERERDHAEALARVEKQKALDEAERLRVFQEEKDKWETHRLQQERDMQQHVLEEKLKLERGLAELREARARMAEEQRLKDKEMARRELEMQEWQLKAQREAEERLLRRTAALDQDMRELEGKQAAYEERCRQLAEKEKLHAREAGQRAERLAFAEKSLAEKEETTLRSLAEREAAVALTEDRLQQREAAFEAEILAAERAVQEASRKSQKEAMARAGELGQEFSRKLARLEAAELRLRKHEEDVERSRVAVSKEQQHLKHAISEDLKRKQQLARLQQEVDRREIAVRSLEAQLEHDKRAVDSERDALRSAVENHRQWMSKTEASLESERAAVQRDAETMQRERGSLETLAREVEGRKAELERVEAEVSRQQTHKRELMRAVEELEARGARLRADLLRAEESVNGARAMAETEVLRPLREKRVELQGVEARLQRAKLRESRESQGLRERVSEAETALQRRKRELQDLDEEAVRKHKSLVALSSQLEKVKTSLSASDHFIHQRTALAKKLVRLVRDLQNKAAALERRVQNQERQLSSLALRARNEQLALDGVHLNSLARATKEAITAASPPHIALSVSPVRHSRGRPRSGDRGRRPEQQHRSSTPTQTLLSQHASLDGGNEAGRRSFKNGDAAAEDDEDDWESFFSQVDEQLEQSRRQLDESLLY